MPSLRTPYVAKLPGLIKARLNLKVGKMDNERDKKMIPIAGVLLTAVALGGCGINPGVVVGSTNKEGTQVADGVVDGRNGSEAHQWKP